jgi:hypothetical protein
MIAYQRINGRAQASDESNCKDPDSELVVRAQAGDRDAFGRLVLQHKESISRVIFRITKNREDGSGLFLHLRKAIFNAFERSVEAIPEDHRRI